MEIAQTRPRVNRVDYGAHGGVRREEITLNSPMSRAKNSALCGHAANTAATWELSENLSVRPSFVLLDFFLSVWTKGKKHGEKSTAMHESHVLVLGERSLIRTELTGLNYCMNG